MTDNEIIKALECCADNTEGKCRECPFHKLKISCIDGLERNALDLINRQKAEIERLTKDKYRLQKALNQSEDYRAIAKDEAIKEFAERLKAKGYRGIADGGLGFIIHKDIDNLVKEMTEEQK